MKTRLLSVARGVQAGLPQRVSNFTSASISKQKGAHDGQTLREKSAWRENKFARPKKQGRRSCAQKVCRPCKKLLAVDRCTAVAAGSLPQSFVSAVQWRGRPSLSSRSPGQRLAAALFCLGLVRTLIKALHLHQLNQFETWPLHVPPIVFARARPVPPLVLNCVPPSTHKKRHCRWRRKVGTHGGWPATRVREQQMRQMHKGMRGRCGPENWNFIAKLERRVESKDPRICVSGARLNKLPVATMAESVGSSSSQSIGCAVWQPAIDAKMVWPKPKGTRIIF